MNRYFCVLYASVMLSGVLEAGPVKVFVLAGQSNMQGHGEMFPATTQGTLSHTIANDPTGKYRFASDGRGGFATFDDVWIHYEQSAASLIRSDLRVGAGANDRLIGPEYGFGATVGQAISDQVFIIKTAWGGKSLAVDFRPPSSSGATGFYYNEILRVVNEGIRDIGKNFPEYAGQGVEIVGFGWHQGWNDRVVESFNDEYEANMVNFIKDIRRDLGTPDLPFVLATTGMSGWAETHPRALSLMNAQLNVPNRAEFQGNVFTVEARGFFRGPEISPRGANQAFHWCGNAKTYLDIGIGMGEAMLDLLGDQSEEVYVTGLTLASATNAITQAGHQVGEISRVSSTTVPVDRIISQSSTTGTINLVVSSGPPVSVANVKLETLELKGISNLRWTRVTLDQTYRSLVVVATPIVRNVGGTPPVVTRLKQVRGNRFDIKLDRLDKLSGEVRVDVSIVAAEVGKYTVAEHGVKMEVVRFPLTPTANNQSWVSVSRAYQNSYQNPVIVGQVLSYQNVDWSVFWSSSNVRSNPANSGSLAVGKHIGEDPNRVRKHEGVGYIVIEAGTGSIAGQRYVAGVGADSVRGGANSSTPYRYSLAGGLGVPSAAALSLAGVDGTDGGWPVLSGTSAFGMNSIGMHILEDELRDAERSHTNEQVAYIVFD